MVRFPQELRGFHNPFGSATLAVSRRIAGGSTFRSEDVDTSRDQVKTFVFRGNIVGSWYIQAQVVGTQFYPTVAEGTYPAGAGSIRTVSFSEAYRRMRASVRVSSVGSASVFYGGYSASRLSG